MAKNKLQKNEREYFPFFRSFRDALNELKELNDTAAELSLYRAIVNYGLDGIEPDNLTGVAVGFWRLMRVNLENSRRKYENGLKGGAPKGNRNAAKRDRERVIEPPTPRELCEFCAANRYNIDEQYFMDYNAAKGWVTTNYRVKDWRDAVREWVATGERNGFDD